ncbi:MAG: MnmC family methyltransferase [Candidatus Omnitrophica bacterium]|nr:MnmC family methyltransferase [Candidatus Omnitrophota bacterium]
MVITKKEWDFILKQPSGSCFKIKTDFGLKEIDACVAEETVTFESTNVISIKEKIKENFCYLVNDNKIEPLAYFSEETNRFYKLTPTGDWPTISIGSVPMHKLSSPKKDTENKIELIKPFGFLLDTCMGLGYSAILSAKSATNVITFEKDENVYELAKLNPLSQALFFSQNIEIRREDVAKGIKTFSENHFDCIIHDPPTFKLAPELFTEGFYGELLRVLKKNARLFHYTPLYKISQGYDFPSKIEKKLKKAGFKILEFKPGKGGIVCKK